VIEDEINKEEVPDSQDILNTAHLDHGRIHWTFYYTDECPIHLDRKNIGYFLERPSLRAITEKTNYKNLLAIVKQEKEEDYLKKKETF
jgi:hypothetical protein